MNLRKILFYALAISFCLFAMAAVGNSLRPYPTNFDGKRFFNPNAAGHTGRLKKGLKFFLTAKRPDYKDITVLPSQPPKTVPPDKMLVTWVGHATLLIQIDGLNILTDPIWSKRASPVSWIGPRRYADPGIRLEDLPPIHVILISHNHYDSLDKETLLALLKTHNPRIYVPLGNAKLLKSWGIGNVKDMGWWQQDNFMDANIFCVPAQHFSSRSLWDRNETLWSGWVVIKNGHRFYFAGDSGYSPQFAEIGRKLGPFTLAAIPIGAYEPRDFMKPMHINPEEAVKVHQDVRSQQSVAIHFNTFRLTLEPQNEPPLKLHQALSNQGIHQDKFWVLNHGERREVTALPSKS